MFLKAVSVLHMKVSGKIFDGAMLLSFNHFLNYFHFLFDVFVVKHAPGTGKACQGKMCLV